MANVYVFFDKRAPRKDGTCPLKLAFSHNRETVYSSLDIRVKPDEWDAEKCQVTTRPDKKFLNVLIRKRLQESMIALTRIVNSHGELSIKQIADMVMRGTDTADEPSVADYVLPVYNEYILLCRKASTASVYRASLNNLIEYEKDIDLLRFKDMNVAWLRKYQSWLIGEQGKGMEVNGANVYLRNLRTIFNYALKNEYTHARYPFKDIDMSTTEPDKRMIPYDKFIEWATMPMPDSRKFYRDLFMLSFYLCGIRPVDLLMVKKSQVQEGRLVYCPQKLNGRTKLSIKIEPEAWEIIRRYEGEKYLINVLESRSDYRAFCQHWNKALKAIGTDVITHHTGRRGKKYYTTKHEGIIPYITVYYARTNWATYAYNLLNISEGVISQALGHKNGLKVTNFYIKRDPTKVDEANRLLIDKVTADIANAKQK